MEATADPESKITALNRAGFQLQNTILFPIVRATDYVFLPGMNKSSTHTGIHLDFLKVHINQTVNRNTVR